MLSHMGAYICYLTGYFNLESHYLQCYIHWDYREGWPLLTVETEVTGVSEYKWKGSFLGWLLVSPIQNMFSSLYTISVPLSPSPSKLGRRPCLVARLLVCVSGYIQLVLSCDVIRRDIHIISLFILPENFTLWNVPYENIATENTLLKIFRHKTFKYSPWRWKRMKFKLVNCIITVIRIFFLFVTQILYAILYEI